MKKQNKNIKKNTKKEPINIFLWTQRHKKSFAGAICIVLVVVMLVSVIQL